MKLTNQQIDDLITTAIEGGINYWCVEAKISDGDYRGAEYASEAVSRGASLVLSINPEEQETVPDPKPLTKKNLLRGIKQAAEFRKLSVTGFLENYDASDADLAVQFAVFNQIYFG